MPKLRSKRQRKQKFANSLRQKKGSGFADSTLELETSFANDGEGVSKTASGIEDSNPLLLPAKRKQPDSEEAATATIHKPSKAQARKLRRIAEEKAKKAEREQVLAKLNAHQLDGNVVPLLFRTANKGQRESKKAGLKRALLMQRAGLPVPQHVRLVMEAAVPDAADFEEDSQAQHWVPSASKQHAARMANSNHSSEGSESEAASEDMEVIGIDKAGDATPTATEGLTQQELLARQKETAAQLRAQLKAQGAAGYESDDGFHGGVDNPRPLDPHYAGAPRVVHITRSAEVSQARESLPIIGMEQEIMEAVSAHDVLVLCGSTGCGKTTQVPQFLYEAGYGCRDFPERCGLIGVTQPRRIAASSTAQRVAVEMNSQLGEVVGYQVRYDKQVGDSTMVKFMTDGILLRELQDDFLLRKYSVIIVDEAHERSLNTDLLTGMLSRIVPLRRSMSLDASSATPVYPLKLIIMSATLRTADFVENKLLFPSPPPLISVPARQYPVTVHFTRRTELQDYVGAAFKKVCRIHKELPVGGILVFLTGQREVEQLCQKLRRTFLRHVPSGPHQRSNLRPAVASAASPSVTRDDVMLDPMSVDAAEADDDGSGEGIRDGGSASAGSRAGGGGDEDDVEAGSVVSEDDIMESGSDEDDVVVLGGEGLSEEEIKEAEKRFEEQLAGSTSGAEGGGHGGTGPLHVVPLYALLPPAAQSAAFQPPPEGCRLVIVATNVAETSLTIPGIRYVVDAGRAKQKLLMEDVGVSKFEVRWISKASAEQRAGRAGRTGPGHCYRLYSSAHFNDTFPEHTPPEILNTPLEGVVLGIKAMGVDKVANFPYPTAPDSTHLSAAHSCLVAIGALDQQSGALTDIGRKMASFPISPRHARMLMQVCHQSDSTALTLCYAVGLAAALSVESPFVQLDAITGDAESVAAQRKAARKAQESFIVADSDAMTVLRVLASYRAAPKKAVFCRQHALHARILQEMSALHKQLCHVMERALRGWALESSKLQGMTYGQLSRLSTDAITVKTGRKLRKAIAAGWSDQVSQRVRSTEHLKSTEGQGKRDRAVRYQAAAVEAAVFLHPRSRMHATSPQYLVYSQITQTEKRRYMTGVTSIEAEWLPGVAPQMCTFSDPLLDPPPFYSPQQDDVMCYRDVIYGKFGWELPPTAQPHPDHKLQCSVFGAALLSGKVLPAFAALRSFLASAPSAMTSPHGTGLARVVELRMALESRKVSTMKALQNEWKEERMYLMPQLMLWMKKGSASKLDAVWVQLQTECTHLIQQRKMSAKKRRLTAC